MVNNCYSCYRCYHFCALEPSKAWELLTHPTGLVPPFSFQAVLTPKVDKQSQYNSQHVKSTTQSQTWLQSAAFWS